MKALEERAFATGASPEALMDEAGDHIASAVQQFFPKRGICLTFFGKGHNGGDALVAARHLGEAGWEVYLVPAFPEDAWSELTKKKFGEAGRCQPNLPTRIIPHPDRPIVLLDGLLGIGASGDLRHPIKHFTRMMNSLQDSVAARIFAIDLPTGLDGDSGKPAADAVRADFTLTIGFPKKGLVADEAINYVGRLAVLPLLALDAAAEKNPNANIVATTQNLAPLLPRRRPDSHKGDYGRVGIIAGSRGFTGAAVMAASACLHAGAGLVSVFVSEEVQPIVATAAPPEVMVRPVKKYTEALEEKLDVLALGPGLGQHRAQEVKEIVTSWKGPMVIDADALNILAHDIELLGKRVGPRLLTPHPGEMARLDPGSKTVSRILAVENFTKAHPVTLLLKGARTLIGERNRPLSYNITGNPGMASGGVGDALTGVCAALAGQKLSLYDAARLAAWVCGRAGELALSHGTDSEESLSATRLIANLGLAFRDLRARSW
jgi:NAD(P)H-hydrate epimerase